MLLPPNCRELPFHACVMETIVSKVKQEVFLPLDLEEENKRLTEELAQCNVCLLYKYVA